MSDANAYCDNAYKRLIGLKAGMYDVMIKAESVADNVHSEAVSHLKTLIDGIEAGIEELKNQCPADWSPNKKDLDDQMGELAETLKKMADELSVIIPDTTAWI